MTDPKPIPEATARRMAEAVEVARTELWKVFAAVTFGNDPKHPRPEIVLKGGTPEYSAFRRAMNALRDAGSLA